MAQETSGLIRNESVDKDVDSVDKEVLDAVGGTEELERVGDESDADDETEAIRQRIDETRSDLSETIDAIQERLSISNISEQVSEQVNSAIESAKETVYDATLGKVVTFMKETRDGIRQTSAGRTVMNNPIPFALIGAGAAMLAYNAWGKGGARRNPAGYRVKPYLTSEGREGIAGSVTGTLSSAAGTLTDKANSVAGTISDKASSAVETVSSTANSAFESASHAASSTIEGARNVASRAYEKAGELGHTAQEQYEHYVEERPLAVAAAAAAVGVAIGLAIPSSRYEGELMGETRDNLLDKAGETANELVAQAKTVATEAGRKLSQEAKTISDSTLSSTGNRPAIQ